MARLEEQQAIIKKTAEEILNQINIMPNIERAKTGRNGKRLYLNIAKKGVNSIEVIIYENMRLVLGIACKDLDVSLKIRSILKQERGYEPIREQKNLRYEYSLDIFLDLYDLIKSNGELEDVASSRKSTKLFDYEFSPEKIVNRYIFAVNNQDQILLDLCRSLLDADRFDGEIKLNDPTEARTYREHVVPCVLIHNKVIELVGSDKKDDAIEIVKHHLKIAYITPDEARYMDYEKGFITSMPDGWIWGGDILARLKSCNIEI